MGVEFMIEINKSSIETFRKDSEKKYPFEACGILIGSNENPIKIIEALPAENINPEKRGDRYEVNPLDIINADRKARKNNCEIVGFYHSHPDTPPIPSQFDLQRAWKDYIYVIISISKGKLSNLKTFRLNENKNEFEEMSINKIG